MIRSYIFALFFFITGVMIEWTIWILRCRKKNLFDKNGELINLRENKE